MLTIIHGLDNSAIEWEIYKISNGEKVKKYSDSPEDIFSAYNDHLQCGLFESNPQIISIIQLDTIKCISNKDVIKTYDLMHESDNNFIIVYHKNILPQSLMNLNAKIIKATNMTQILKNKIIVEFLNNNNIRLSTDDFNALSSLLPNDINCIKNEVRKISVLTDGLNVNKIKDVVLDYNNDSIFEIANFVMKNDYEKAICLTKKILHHNTKPEELIPLLSYQIFNFKMFLIGKKHKMNHLEIQNAYSISTFQQKNMGNVLYNISISNALDKTNRILNKLYEFDKANKSIKINHITYLISCLTEGENNEH